MIHYITLNEMTKHMPNEMTKNMPNEMTKNIPIIDPLDNIKTKALHKSLTKNKCLSTNCNCFGDTKHNTV